MLPNTKKSFTLVELAVVMVIISVMLATVMVSRQLILLAKANKAQQDSVDIQKLMTIFKNTFDCLPGDCPISRLPSSIIYNTPSACFNMQSDYKTPVASDIISAFDTNEIDSNAKRTCAFYEMQAMDPWAFGPQRQQTAIVKNILGTKTAFAIGPGIGLYIKDNPKIQQAQQSGTSSSSIQQQIQTKQETITSNNTTIQQQQEIVTACEPYQNMTSMRLYTPSGWALSSFFNNNLFSFTSNGISGAGTTDIKFSVYVENAGTYSLQSSADDSATLQINNSSTTIKAVGFESDPPENSVSLVSGVNILSLSLTNVGSTHVGASILIKDSNGNKVWSARDAVTKSIVGGIGAFSGSCPDSCSGSGCFCPSTCRQKVGNVSAMQGYNNAADKITTLTSQNKVLSDEITTLQNNPNTDDYISLSIEGATNPAIPGQKTSIWDIRTNQHKDMPADGFYPFELTNNSALFKEWDHSVTILARSANTESITNSSSNMSGLSAKISSIIDRKFDDGLPYSGAIVAGKNMSQLTNDSACTKTTISDIKNLNTANVYYASGTSVDKGCVLAWRSFV